jgi:hypothetical protein
MLDDVEQRYPAPHSAADLTVERIGDLVDCDLATLLANAGKL